jgi:tetrapyrrole methylase family protein/MazG family protein
MSAYLLEETYELVEAIETGIPDDVCEELGDVLFQILFIASLFQEMGYFDIGTVARRNTQKMICRHPHVFGEDRVDNVEDVKKRWREMKTKEKHHNANSSVFDDVCPKLPALMRAQRISECAARKGLDRDDMLGVIQKMEAAWTEFKHAITGKNKPLAHQKLGDVLFRLLNVARLANVNPETSLIGAIKAFEKRYEIMERTIVQHGGDIENVPPDKMQELWINTKKAL